MSENEPQDTEEWEDYADMKYKEIKRILKDIENKGSSSTVEDNLRNASKSFGDMLISMSALAYKVTSEVAHRSADDVTTIQQNLAGKTNKARNIVADELDKVSKHLRSED
jgi:hypothetical protein